MTETTDGGALTISAAARVVGVDRRIIRRHLEAGSFPGAVRAVGVSGTGTGPWQIPLGDLRDTGLLASGAPEGTDAPARRDAESAPSGDLELELGRLRAELAAAIRRAETAEVAVLECERVIEAQRLTLAERSSLNGRNDPKIIGRNRRYPLNGRSTMRSSTSASIAAASDGPSRPEPDEPDTAADELSPHSDEDARVWAAMAEVADAVGRPRSTPRFATSWASAPPWEHVPEVSQPAQRRRWRRVS